MANAIFAILVQKLPQPNVLSLLATFHGAYL